MKAAAGRLVGLGALLAGVGFGAVAGAPDPGTAASALLGVQVREESGRPQGARVTYVVEGSPAAAAGIRVGDLLLTFDGEPIHGPAELTRRIQARRPGDRVALTVDREGQERSLEVELGQRARRSPSPAVTEAPEIPSDVLQRLQDYAERLGQPQIGGWTKPRLGVQLVETTPELRVYLGGTAGAGVLVSKVLRGMPAERAGIAVGDLIVAVEGTKVATAQELVEALDEQVGRTFRVELIRARAARTVEVTLPDPEEIDRPTGPRA